jgi:hypothetical protein
MAPRIEHVGSQHAVVGATKLALGDQVNDVVVFEQGNVRVLAGVLLQRCLDGASGGVGGVHDAPVRVSPLAGQVKL